MRARANRDDARINVCVRYMRGFLAVARCEARRLRRRSMWGDCPRRHGVHRCASARHSRLNTAHGEVRLEERGVDVVDHGCCEYLSGRGRRVHGSSDDSDCGHTGQPPCNVRSLPPPPTLPPHTHTRAIVAKRPGSESARGAEEQRADAAAAPPHPPATCPPACMRRPLGLRARARRRRRQGLRAGSARARISLPPTAPPTPPTPPHPPHAPGPRGGGGSGGRTAPRLRRRPPKLTRALSVRTDVPTADLFFFFKRRWVGFCMPPGVLQQRSQPHPNRCATPVWAWHMPIALGSDE